MASSNTGTCFLCNEVVNHHSITKHVEKCLGNDASQDHDGCTEDFILPVVNSPRMGVCGYCGPDF